MSQEEFDKDSFVSVFIKATLGILTVCFTVGWALAAIFAPIGVVWLVLTH